MLKLLFGKGFTLRGKDGDLGNCFVSACLPGEVHFGFAVRNGAAHAHLSTDSARELGSALLAAATIQEASDRAKKGAKQ